MKNLKLLLSFVLLGLVIFACQTNRNEESLMTPSVRTEAMGDCPSISYTLWAGQNINAGTVSITNDATNVYVTYATTGDWYIAGTHLYVGPEANIPKNRQGIVVPGQFPYKNTFSPAVQTYTYTLPIANLTKDANGCYVVVAHAELVRIVNGEVVQSETGFGYTTPWTNTPRWGGQFSYCLQTCVVIPPTGYKCDTGFAKDPTSGGCFSQDGFSRWGWSLGAYNLSTSFTKSLPIYLGAAKCDTTKAALAGYANISYVAGSNQITVTYVMNAGFSLNGTHVYVGAEKYPTLNGKNTVAPGQYGNNHDGLEHATTDSYTIDVTGLSSVYMIIHADACKKL